MSHDGQRLERLRKWLPKDEGAEVTPRALSVYLNLDPGKWRSMERKAAWSKPQKALLGRVLPIVLGNTTLPAEAVQSALVFTERGAGALPPLGGATWVAGHGPALDRGRPEGTRLEEGPDGRKKAILPPRERPTPHDLTPLPSVSPIAQAATSVADAARAAVEAGYVTSDRAMQAILDEVRSLIRAVGAHKIDPAAAEARALSAIKTGMSAAGIVVASGHVFWELLARGGL